MDTKAALIIMSLNVINSHGEDSYPGHETLSECDVEEMESVQQA